MRRVICCKIRPSGTGLPCLLGKIFLSFFVLYGLFQVLKNNVLKTDSRLRERSLADMTSTSNWQCELNKRMSHELRKEIKEKEKLLNYRGKVIAKLRSQLIELNSTNSVLRDTLENLTDVMVSRKKHTIQHTERHHNVSEKIKYETVPFPENIKDKVDRAARPCCIALKRMTDILRVYMETTQDLREQVAAYRQLNITEKMYEYAEIEKRKFATLNCSERFRNEIANLTKKSEKHALYQTYSRGFFYETFPVNRINPKQKFKSKSYHRNIDFAKAVNFALQEVIKDTKLPSTLFEMNDALVRYDELRGSEYKLTFLFNKTRAFSVDVIKPFGPHIVPQRITEQTLKSKELINIIVPVSGRKNRLKEFLENIRHAVLEQGGNLYLTVIIYGTDTNNTIKNIIKKFSRDNNFKNYDVFKKNLPFNRGRALHDGITRWNGYNNVLMFLCDVDIKFDYKFLTRCRQNSVLGKSVYMPIVFSLYNPEIVFRNNFTETDRFNISDTTGTWRPLGYGMLCVYKPDYINARGFNLRINGWGGEDVNLYHRFLKKGLKVIRAPDPDLYHVWHPKLCSNTLSKRQYETCIGSKARYEGSQRQLGVLLLSKNKTTF